MRTSFEAYLRSNGHSLEEHGVENYGLLRNQALQAILLLRGTGVAVLGLSVLEPSSGRYFYRPESLDTERQAGEGFDAYSMRSQDEALRFLRGFGAMLPSDALFEIVVANEQEYLALTDPSRPGMKGA